MTTLTTTLEMSKLLKLAGWSKETVFWYEKSSLNPHKVQFGKCIFSEYQAPTITELLEELDNNVILQFENDMQVGLPVGDFIDLFRSPDKLAECWLWAKKEGLIK